MESVTMQKIQKLLIIATSLFFTLTTAYAKQQPVTAGYLVKVSNADKTPRLLYFFSRRNIQCAPHSLIISDRVNLVFPHSLFYLRQIPHISRWVQQPHTHY